MAEEARAPSGDFNNNNNNNNKVILIVILINMTYFISYDSISLNILKFARNNFYL
jgi:hypothetical protein